MRLLALYKFGPGQFGTRQRLVKMRRCRLSDEHSGRIIRHLELQKQTRIEYYPPLI
jgi:hypothetical protein